jgi:hypothetical protein
MLYDKFKEVRSERTVKSLIGISMEQFNRLADIFKNTWLENKTHAGGNPGVLNTPEKALFFILYHIKNYQSFDVLGFHFGFSGGKAHDNVNRILPLLLKSLSMLNVVPEREPKSIEDFNKMIEKCGEIIIDCTESAVVRPANNETQKDYYSGKKNATQ